MAMWLCGYGCVAMRLYGYVATWLCRYVAILNLVRIARPVDSYSCPGPTCLHAIDIPETSLRQDMQ